MKSMKSRERVLRALNHQEVDRVPIDLGGTHNTTMCTGAYENFKHFLGVEVPTEELIVVMEVARMDEQVLQRLPVDTRGVFIKPPENTKSRWLDRQTLIDDWGITFHQPDNWKQFDIIAHPLAEATQSDLESYDWPDMEDPARYAGLETIARDLHEQTDYAICGTTMDTAIFERSWMLRGMQQFLTELLTDPEFALALMEKVTDLQCRRLKAFLQVVGRHIDIIMIGDDLGSQKGPLIRPQLYRKMIKPLHARLVQVIRQHTDARIVNHSCGSIVELIPDYIENGIDALNPMQVSAAGMSPQNLKEKAGGRIAFWGGIDSQSLLPKGQPEDVRRAVRETIQTMGKSGGYVLGSVHNVQDDVPPENVWAMLEEASRFVPA